MSVAAGLYPKQVDSVRDSRAMINLWEGAVSSGKTVASMARFALYLCGTMDLPGECVIVGRTRNTAWRNIVNPMRQLFPGMVKGNTNAPSCEILGRRVHVIGASDSQAEAVIRGMTALVFYIDELTLIPRAFFEMAISRLRVHGRNGGLASKLFATTNPDTPTHWLKKEYIDKAHE